MSSDTEKAINDMVAEVEQIVSQAHNKLAQPVSFCFVVQFDDGKMCSAGVKIASQSDHHFCDMMTTIMQTWWNNNHGSGAK